MLVDLPTLVMGAIKAIESLEERVQLYDKKGDRVFLHPRNLVYQFERCEIGDPNWYDDPNNYRLAQTAYIKSKIYVIAKEEGYRAAMMWRLSYGEGALKI